MQWHSRKIPAQLQRAADQVIRSLSALTVLPLLLIPLSLNAATEQAPAPDATGKTIKKGTFLVATKNLTGSSFSETVILITHYSNWGATGLAINRPAKITLEEAFPDVQQLHDNRNELFLGGPVKPDTIFVLMKTKRPDSSMRNIADDVYFAPGISAFAGSRDQAVSKKTARAFAGYSGWAPGQLEAEIRRGDWLVIESDLDIVFTEENQSLWKKLTHDWSGSWI